MRLPFVIAGLAMFGAPNPDLHWRGSPVRAELSPRDSALHALNRLAYGPRPGEVDRVAALGVMHWIDQQLDPGRLPDRILAGREREFAILSLDPEGLARIFAEARRDRVERGAEFNQAMAPASQALNWLRQLVGQVQQLAVVRAVLSERQLQEVMTDFWVNHFNVYSGKGADRVLMPIYIEHTIRPRALGTFADLLLATAQSPAMMFYLDNWESVATGAVPPGVGRTVGRPRGGAPARGPNENYARELLELHTLGVDGGYTQRDVMEVARVFTGWSIARPAQSGRFEFNAWAHDRGEKTVRGVRFPAGGGQEEGIRLLKLLANDPATMRFVSHKLCARFVRDEPPDGCVDDAVAAWQRSGGDITDVVRAIVHTPDFWSAQTMRAKIKTPLEFVVSAVRAVGGEPNTTLELAEVVGRLGQPLYMEPSPAGYPESQEEWVNSGALLHRMNAAVALAAGRLPGVTISLDGVLSPTDEPDTLIHAVDTRLLGGILSPRSRAVMRDQVDAVRNRVAARALAVGLALGGPEFQRQ